MASKKQQVNAVNDSDKNKFDIMMAWMTPVSLHFSDVPAGSNNLNRQTTLGY